MTALLGLLGGGLVRYVLDRHASMTRAVGYARAVQSELQEALMRLDEDEASRFVTSAWDQYGTELASALLHEEFMLLNAVYRLLNSLNRGIPEPGKYVRRLVLWPEMDRFIAQSQVTQGLSAVAWLARGDIPMWRRRRVQNVLPADDEARCRCGHRWGHHRASYERRRSPIRRWRSFNSRVVAHECNVEGCACSWWREPRRPHLPRWVQKRFGVGLQVSLPRTDGGDDEPVFDPSIPPDAQPFVVVPADEA